MCNGTSDIGTGEHFCAGFCSFEIEWNPSMKNISLFFLIFLKYASISLAACGTRLAFGKRSKLPQTQKSAEWDEIAQRLGEAFSDGENFLELKGRGCRERMERLLQKRRADRKIVEEVG